MLRLYDSLTREVRGFSPENSPVTIYVCGITPYDATHLGHAFTFVSFDVLIRYLRYQGRSVRYVQNVTDIDDPLFEKARQLGVDYEELARSETAQYQADMRGLGVTPPNVYPYASREIPNMIALIERLIRSGHAYQIDGHVYFDVRRDPEYGELSRYDRETMIAVARERGGDPDDPIRRDPLDFVLWRPAEGDEPRFESPWGQGLPGWHLECSAMALRYLGETLDIHGGGADLIFPHHENEIAQSEAATGKHPFVRYWMHTGMVYLDGEKMSKSLGNMVFVRDLLPEYGSDAVRLYLSACQYRASLHYDSNELSQAADRARTIVRAGRAASSEDGPPLNGEPFLMRFEERMNDDLDTPAAIDILLELSTAITHESERGGNVTSAQEILRGLSSVLGLSLTGVRAGAPV